MYIQPNTTIKLLAGVPLDNEYIHTLNLADKTAQFNYFNSKVKATFPAQTYQRVNNTTCRVQISADTIYDCNYMMFQNTSYSNKWFYAFITKINYINNAVAEIEYEIDVIQTWLYDITFDQCYVEREHTEDDSIGANILPENVEIGEYVFNTYNILDNGSDMAYIIAIVDVQSEVGVAGKVYDNVYGSCTLIAYNSNSTGISNLNAKINEYKQSPDSILAIYCCPTSIVSASDSGKIVPFKSSGMSTIHEFQPINQSARLDGYLPKNNKMYTYPYNYLYVDNSDGSSLSLRYEFFQDLKPVLRTDGTISMPVTMVTRPCGYKNVGAGSSITAYNTLNTEKLVMNGFPVCSWGTDFYSAWAAQNSVPIMLNTVSSVLPVIGGNNGNGTGLLGTATNLITQNYKASIHADVSKGNIASANVNVASFKQNFYQGRVSVNSEYARMIDNYFDRFGYSVNALKYPQFNSRPYWNYIKTLDCGVATGCPSDDAKKIGKIFDNGITFWHTVEHFGEYYRDNRPIRN